MSSVIFHIKNTHLF